MSEVARCLLSQDQKGMNDFILLERKHNGLSPGNGFVECGPSRDPNSTLVTVG